MVIQNKQDRINLIVRICGGLPCCTSGSEAVLLINGTFDLVEDLFSGLTKLDDPQCNRGRMCGPDEFFRSKDPSPAPDVRVYIHRSHTTLIKENGAYRIEVRKPARLVILDMPGADGRYVSER